MGEGAGQTGRRSGGEGEHRWPPVVAVLVAAGVYAMLPESVQVLPRWVIPALEVALLVALVATNPVRFTRQTRWSRAASLALAGLVVLSNLTALGLLISHLNTEEPPEGMLMAAMQIWLTNVIGFGLLYWELDRGGPVARRCEPREDLPLADFRFSQDEDFDTVTEVKRGSSEVCDWVPVLGDYLYVSLTNSSAFSPTDTMPLSLRAKALMGTEATAALLTSLLVVAKAVGSLGGGGGG